LLFVQVIMGGRLTVMGGRLTGSLNILLTTDMIDILVIIKMLKLCDETNYFVLIIQRI